MRGVAVKAVHPLSPLPSTVFLPTQSLLPPLLTPKMEINESKMRNNLFLILLGPLLLFICSPVTIFIPSVKCIKFIFQIRSAILLLFCVLLQEHLDIGMHCDPSHSFQECNLNNTYSYKQYCGDAYV